MIKVGVRADPEDESIYARSESWRNCLYASLRPERDGSDWRYFFRFKDQIKHLAAVSWPS